MVVKLQSRNKIKQKSHLLNICLMRKMAYATFSQGPKVALGKDILNIGLLKMNDLLHIPFSQKITNKKNDFKTISDEKKDSYCPLKIISGLQILD